MGLVEELQKNYKINIAGPSTMAAMLNLSLIHILLWCIFFYMKNTQKLRK